MSSRIFFFFADATFFDIFFFYLTQWHSDIFKCDENVNSLGAAAKWIIIVILHLIAYFYFQALSEGEAFVCRLPTSLIL